MNEVASYTSSDDSDSDSCVDESPRGSESVKSRVVQHWLCSTCCSLVDM